MPFHSILTHRAFGRGEVMPLPSSSARGTFFRAFALVRKGALPAPVLRPAGPHPYFVFPGKFVLPVPYLGREAWVLFLALL